MLASCSMTWTAFFIANSDRYALLCSSVARLSTVQHVSWQREREVPVVLSEQPFHSPQARIPYLQLSAPWLHRMHLLCAIQSGSWPVERWEQLLP